jgi:hypothetical protein
MKAALKAFDCVDHDPIAAWRPTDSESVDYWLCLHIGPAGKEGADLFYVQVLSGTDGDVVASGKKIVVSEYSWAAVKARVEEIVGAADGEDWNAVAKNLSESFDWEFEGYEEFKGKA